MTGAYYLTDGAHVLIAGSTGAGDKFGGKTVLANWWFEQSVRKGHHDIGLFINPKGHGFVKGRTVQSLKGVAESYRSGNRLFDVRTSNPDPYIEWLRHMPGTKIVVFDEAWEYSDSEQLQWAVRAGGNLDSGSIRSIIVSQRVWDLPDSIRGNCPIKIWVGPLTPEGRAYLEAERMGDAVGPIRQNAGKHTWAVTDGGEYLHTNGPVPAKYA